MLDLNGNGVQTLALGATTGRFDLMNNGDPIRSGWLSAEDGFLALDLNANGTIDNRAELFGGGIGEGFAQLSALDSNGDAVVDAADARFGELRVWQDSNSNHQTDAGELQSLVQAGVASLSTDYVTRPRQQNGNLLLETSQAMRTDGTPMDMVDTYFRVATGAGTATAAPAGKRGVHMPEFVFRAGQPDVQPDALRAAAVIDWASTPRLHGALQGNRPPASGHGEHWLSGLLAGEGGQDNDLATMTGLKVTLTAESRAH